MLTLHYDDLLSCGSLCVVQIVRLRGPKVPVVVVGNKTDLDSRRAVPRATVEARVELDWNHGYTETCALQSDSVLALFKKVLHQGEVSGAWACWGLHDSLTAGFIIYNSNHFVHFKLTDFQVW